MGCQATVGSYSQSPPAKDVEDNALPENVSSPPKIKIGEIVVQFGSAIFSPYPSLIIADVLDAVGNCTWNVVVEVLVEPKSKTKTAGLVVPLYL